MKKTFIPILCILLGLFIGIFSVYIILFKLCAPETVMTMVYSDSDIGAAHTANSQSSSSDNEKLIELAFESAQYIKERDFVALSSVVHPVYGVVFTPYSTVNLSSDECFSVSDVAAFGNNTTKYVWGAADGSGSPIEMTVSEYFERYVFDRDYTAAPIVGVDHIVQTGNSLENISDIFPYAHFIDFSFPSSDSESADWTTLRLVFEDYNGEWKLAAIIHCEWTV